MVVTRRYCEAVPRKPAPKWQPQNLGIFQGDLVSFCAAGACSAKLPADALGHFAWDPSQGTFHGWKVEGVLSVIRDQLVVHEIRVQPTTAEGTPPGAGLTTTVLRSLPLGGLVAALRAVVEEAPEQVAELERSSGETFEELKKQTQRAARAVRGTGLKRGRKGYPDDHYRWVALEYLALQAEGWSRGILVELAKRATKHLGRDFVARETVRDWVAEARKRQFLTKATQGRAGAGPGPNLYNLTKKGTKP